jgi:hypothetical protein
MGSLEFSVDLIQPVVVWPWDRLRSTRSPGGNGQLTHNADNLTAICEAVVWKDVVASVWLRLSASTRIILAFHLGIFHLGLYSQHCLELSLLLVLIPKHIYTMLFPYLLIYLPTCLPVSSPLISLFTFLLSYSLYSFNISQESIFMDAKKFNIAVKGVSVNSFLCLYI